MTPSIPKQKPAPYTPTTPVTDSLITERRKRPLFGVGTSSSGATAPAQTGQRSLIGGSV